MKIRNAQPCDLDRIMEIYAGARRFMSEHGNPNQWGPTCWPPEELIRKDIDSSRSFVCVDDSEIIVGVFFFDQGEDIEETYLDISDGEWKGSNTYGVVHRIASDASQKGIGATCINWAYEQCGHLRMDTHPDNYVMQGLLTKLGFEKCGIIHVIEDNYPRYAYEKN